MREIDIRIKCKSCDGVGGYETQTPYSDGRRFEYVPGLRTFVVECKECKGYGKVMPIFEPLELETGGK